MKSTNRKLAIKVLALAVQGALAAMAAAPLAAYAQSDEGEDVATLTNPTNTVEIGVANVAKDSTKFGEYNGMNKKGPYLIGNVDAKGGDSYGMNSGTRRWSVNVTDLGTTSRELGASISNQGSWQVGVGFDQLRHYTTTNYQTPYQGSIGGNNFVLPSDFGVINTNKTAAGATGGATSTNLLGGRSLTATQLGEFQTRDVYTQRENTKFLLGYDFNPNWNFRFDYNHLDQSGAKLSGSGTDPFAPTGSFGGISTWGGERPVILMNPTNYRTETANVAFNWTGDNSFATVAYHASLFHDNYNGITWSNPFQTTSNTGVVPAAGLPTSTMSTPPSNQFHQLNLTGGYNFSRATHLTGGVSYARNTQNDSFNGTYTPGFVTNLPGNSLDGLVVIKHADAKLTNKTTANLTLSGAAKYDERDNRTASNLYTYYDEGKVLREAWSIPMSNKKHQVELAGDYRVSANQKLRIGYQYEKIERWCNNAPSLAQITGAYSFAGTSFSGTNQANAAAYYGGGSSCVQVPESTENRISADYHVKATDTVNLNLGVATGKRKATINTAFYNPMQSVTEGFENPGFVAFFDASRKENLFKAGVNWQATEALSLGASAKYRKDDYTDLTFGVGNGKLSSINLDAAYSYSDNASVAAYATWQWRSRDLNTESGRLPVAKNVAVFGPWSNTLDDKDFTFGITGKQKGLMGNKLELNEDLAYSIAKSDYNTTVNYTITPSSQVGCDAANNISCGAPPTIKSDMLRFRLSGKYSLDRSSAITVGYLYQRLKADDYYYNVYQYPYGFTTGLPTNQQAPSYSQNVIYATYVYSFK